MAENIRIALPEGLTLEEVEKAETILIVARETNLSEYLATYIKDLVSSYPFRRFEKMATGEEMLQKVKEQTGKEYSRQALAYFRANWVDGEDYYSAASGKSRVFRYDLERCLPVLIEAAKKREKTQE